MRYAIVSGEPAPDERIVTTRAPVELHRTLSALRHGPFDPTYRAEPDGTLWRATRLRSGVATLRLRQHAPATFAASAWGPGASEALATLTALLGDDDGAESYDPPPGPARDAYRACAHVRIPRSGRVMESLVPAILEQRVTSRTAHAAWRWLLLAHGEPAPGPAPEGLRVPPDPRTWASVPSWDFHRAGVDPRRARTVVAAAHLADRLEEAVDMTPDAAHARLRHVPGVGQWTAAETLQRAIGDTDAVPVGDFHLPAQVGWALARRRVDDEEMLALLEPYRPHRYRVIRHLLLAGLARAPGRGPRLPIEDHRRR